MLLIIYLVSSYYYLQWNHIIDMQCIMTGLIGGRRGRLQFVFFTVWTGMDSGFSWLFPQKFSTLTLVNCKMKACWWVIIYCRPWKKNRQHHPFGISYCFLVFKRLFIKWMPILFCTFNNSLPYHNSHKIMIIKYGGCYFTILLSQCSVNI